VLARESFAFGGFSLNQNRKISGNPEIPEIFLSRKSLTSDITEFRAGDGTHSLKFLTVQYSYRRETPRRDRRVQKLRHLQYKSSLCDPL
jgi:hypothetical protein